MKIILAVCALAVSNVEVKEVKNLAKPHIIEKSPNTGAIVGAIIGNFYGQTFKGRDS